MISKSPVLAPICKQMDHALGDLGFSKTGTAQTTSAWSEEPHSIHPSTISSEVGTGAANFDQTNMCCYCFTRRADHLIIDCREFLSEPSLTTDFKTPLFVDEHYLLRPRVKALLLYLRLFIYGLFPINSLQN